MAADAQPQRRPPVSGTVARPRLIPRPENEADLFDRWIQVGLDGSVVKDDQLVYVLSNSPMRKEDGHGPIQRIDYFHGLKRPFRDIFGTPQAQMHADEADVGIPIAQMHTDEANVLATEMISINGGFTVQRIKKFQKKWRARRAREYWSAGCARCGPASTRETHFCFESVD